MAEGDDGKTMPDRAGSLDVLVIGGPNGRLDVTAQQLEKANAILYHLDGDAREVISRYKEHLGQHPDRTVLVMETSGLGASGKQVLKYCGEAGIPVAHTYRTGYARAEKLSQKRTSHPQAL